MKGLPALIKLKQRELDTLRRELAELEQELENLRLESKRLAEELTSEQKLAAESPEMGAFYGKFAKGIEEKQKLIQRKSRDVNEKIRKLRDTIFEAFTELKRLEIARDNLLAAEEEEKKKQEQMMLDEVGIQQFTRHGRETKKSEGSSSS